MRPERLTVKAQEALQAAQAQARRRDHQAVDVEHLVLAMLEQAEGTARPVLEKMGIDWQQAWAEFEADIKRLEGLGARLLEGPIEIPGGPRICFVQAPDDVRVELIQRRAASIAGGCC